MTDTLVIFFSKKNKMDIKYDTFLIIIQKKSFFNNKKHIYSIKLITRTAIDTV